VKTSLEQLIRNYYWRKELRGQVCRVHHYQRPGGAEYFFAYLPDWPDKRLVFDAEGNLTAREEAYTFNNVFIYEPATGTIELMAKGVGQCISLCGRHSAKRCWGSRWTTRNRFDRPTNSTLDFTPPFSVANRGVP